MLISTPFLYGESEYLYLSKNLIMIIHKSSLLLVAFYLDFFKKNLKIYFLFLNGEKWKKNRSDKILFAIDFLLTQKIMKIIKLYLLIITFYFICSFHFYFKIGIVKNSNMVGINLWFFPYLDLYSSYAYNIYLLLPPSLVSNLIDFQFFTFFL